MCALDPTNGYDSADIGIGYGTEQRSHYTTLCSVLSRRLGLNLLSCYAIRLLLLLSKHLNFLSLNLGILLRTLGWLIPMHGGLGSVH